MRANPGAFLVLTSLGVISIAVLSCSGGGDSSIDAGIDLDAGGPEVTRESGADATTQDSMPVDATTQDGGGASLDAADAFDGFACDPSQSPHDEPCVVDMGNAVFVAPPSTGGSDTTGDGTRSRPYATIGHALANLGGNARVYLCDGTYAESVSLTMAASLYGGLACPAGDAGWNYVGGQAQLHGRSQLALAIDRVPTAIAIEDVSIAAANVVGQDDAGNGKSSIAAFVNESTVAFRRCTFTAGSADNGRDGTTPSNYGVVTAPGGEASDGGIGGAGGGVICNDGTSATGGDGGNARLTNDHGGDGTAVPLPPTYPSLALDGLGGAGGTTCKSGDNGAYGMPADGGMAPTTYGTANAGGWTPSAGSAGANGNPGQGGGGGGGHFSSSQGGAGGGAGGCGGAGGIGGGGGGASIALACVAGAVSLDGCLLRTSTAGHGGNGGDGQSGQGGGPGGAPATNLVFNSPIVTGCEGGVGGNGAGGGGGAGGAGGISVCIVYRGKPPMGTPLCVPGAAGRPGVHGGGGAGGTNAWNATAPDGGAGQDGLDGISGTVLQAP